MQRKQYSAEFKTKADLEAIKGLKTVNEIASEFGVVYVFYDRNDELDKKGDRLGEVGAKGDRHYPLTSAEIKPTAIAPI